MELSKNAHLPEKFGRINSRVTSSSLTLLLLKKLSSWRYAGRYWLLGAFYVAFRRVPRVANACFQARNFGQLLIFGGIKLCAI